LLSYRHAFHAGNPADVLKHICLVLTLDYYAQKNKPFWYIDTHAGSGLYRLDSAEAQKNAEFAQGIQAIWNAKRPPKSLQPYFQLLQVLNRGEQIKYYPGSPWFAAHCLRPGDQLRLFELHPTDYAQLATRHKADRHVYIEKQDGFKGLVGLLPPITRRAVVLLDPSYELKNDYETVISTLCKAHQRFATGTYLLWYPVIARQRVNKMTRQLQAANIPNILQVELRTAPDRDGIGMTGSGLFIINPPWALKQQMLEILPWLKSHIAGAHGDYSLQQIAPEKK